MVAIENVNFSYGNNDFSLKINDFHVNQGEKVAVIGPSGSGKTTFLDLISGILVPKKGSIVVNENKINTLSDNQRRDFRIQNIGFVFQNFELLEYLNGFENIILPYRISSALKLDSTVITRAKELADRLNIGSIIGRKPNELSQGEKQRVAICRSIITQPKLILADEATGNLDPKNKKEIMRLLFDVMEFENTSLILVTHDHELLPKFQRVVDFNNFLS